MPEPVARAETKRRKELKQQQAREARAREPIVIKDEVRQEGGPAGGSLMLFDASNMEQLRLPPF